MKKRWAQTLGRPGSKQSLTTQNRFSTLNVSSANQLNQEMGRISIDLGSTRQQYTTIPPTNPIKHKASSSGTPSTSTTSTLSKHYSTSSVTKHNQYNIDEQAHSLLMSGRLPCKVVILGSKNVGKTQLLFSFVHQRWHPDYDEEALEQSDPVVIVRQNIITNSTPPLPPSIDKPAKLLESLEKEVQEDAVKQEEDLKQQIKTKPPPPPIPTSSSFSSPALSTVVSPAVSSNSSTTGEGRRRSASLFVRVSSNRSSNSPTTSIRLQSDTLSVLPDEFSASRYIQTGKLVAEEEEFDQILKNTLLTADKLHDGPNKIMSRQSSMILASPAHSSRTSIASSVGPESLVLDDNPRGSSGRPKVARISSIYQDLTPKFLDIEEEPITNISLPQEQQTTSSPQYIPSVGTTPVSGTSSPTSVKESTVIEEIHNNVISTNEITFPVTTPQKKMYKLIDKEKILKFIIDKREASTKPQDQEALQDVETIIEECKILENKVQVLENEHEELSKLYKQERIEKLKLEQDLTEVERDIQHYKWMYQQLQLLLSNEPAPSDFQKNVQGILDSIQVSIPSTEVKSINSSFSLTPIGSKRPLSFRLDKQTPILLRRDSANSHTEDGSKEVAHSQDLLSNVTPTITPSRIQVEQLGSAPSSDSLHLLSARSIKDNDKSILSSYGDDASTDDDMTDISDIGDSKMSTPNNIIHYGMNDLSHVETGILKESLSQHENQEKVLEPLLPLNTFANSTRISCSKLMEGITKFNRDDVKQRDAIKFLIQNEILADHPAVIARFLVYTASLRKGRVGEYLGHLDNQIILQHYCDFLTSKVLQRLPFDGAFRVFFSLFNLPLEGQVVTRIADCFAQSYVKHHSNLKMSPDCATLVACALLMLNTNLHNPKVKLSEKMSKETFATIFTGQNLPKEYLDSLWEGIKANPMIIKPDDEEVDSDDNYAYPAASFIQKSVEDAVKTISNKDTRPIHLRQRSISVDFTELSNTSTISGTTTSNVVGLKLLPSTLYYTRVFLGEDAFSFYIKDVDLQSSTSLQLVNNTEFETSMDKIIQKADIFICTYSVTDMDSFTFIQHLIDKIVKQKSFNFDAPLSSASGQLNSDEVFNVEQSKGVENIILVGCKADCKEEERQVSFNDGAHYALRRGIPFFEVSANTNKGVKQVFMTAFENLAVIRKKIQEFQKKQKEQQLSQKQKKKSNTSNTTNSATLTFEELIALPKMYI